MRSCTGSTSQSAANRAAQRRILLIHPAGYSNLTSPDAEMKERRMGMTAGLTTALTFLAFGFVAAMVLGMI